jgi:LysR family hydrogen peroxide-inducible transcriptional activator
MTITQLKYVLAVAEHKKFHISCRKVFCTTLVCKSKKIEEELSILIFDRSKKPILTDIGQKIVNQAKTLSMKLDGSRTLSNSKRFVGGDFRLGNTNDHAYTASMFLNNFIKKHPKVKLIIEELNTEEIITKLKAI